MQISRDRIIEICTVLFCIIAFYINPSMLIAVSLFTGAAVAVLALIELIKWVFKQWEE